MFFSLVVALEIEGLERGRCRLRLISEHELAKLAR